MNITSPFLKGAIQIAELPGNSVTSVLRVVGASTGWFDDGPDGGLGLVMSALAGIAAALAVAIVLSVYFRSGYRSRRDILKHGFAAAAVLALLAFVISDMRHAALAYLGIDPSKPAIEFEIRMPKAAPTAIAYSQVELRTDRNQKLAQVRDTVETIADGRSVLRGTVSLDYRTTERVLLLDLPGAPQRQFRLRLPASPSHSDQFGPWHLSDGVTASNGGGGPPAPNDAYAIRYRVL